MANPGGHELALQLPSLPERVWDALTNPVKLAKWFGESDLVPEVGRRFTITPRTPVGFDGPITGEVLAVEAPRRLVMRWRTPTGDLVMTWLVEPGRGGTTLRVVQSSVLGPDLTSPGLPDTYRALFDEHLRAFLRAGMLGRIQPPPRPKPPASLFEPVVDPGPVSSPVATFGAVPPDPGSDGRRPWEPRPHRDPRRRWPPGLLIGAVTTVVLALFIAAWVAASSGALTSWSAPGPQGSPLDGSTSPLAPAPGGPGGPGGPGPGVPGSRPSGDPGGPGPSGAPPSSAAAEQPPAPPDAVPPLTVGYQIPSITALGYTAEITVANPADQDQDWQNAKVNTTGLNILVSNLDGAVRYNLRNNTICFYPDGPVPAGGSTTFTFDVTAPLNLGTIATVTLNDATC